METKHAIEALGALAHEHRLGIYRLLVEQGPEGLSAGAIGESVGLTPSSLTFHLQNLHRAGLIVQRRVVCNGVQARFGVEGGQAKEGRLAVDTLLTTL